VTAEFNDKCKPYKFMVLESRIIIGTNKDKRNGFTAYGLKYLEWRKLKLLSTYRTSASREKEKNEYCLHVWIWAAIAEWKTIRKSQKQNKSHVSNGGETINKDQQRNYLKAPSHLPPKGNQKGCWKTQHNSKYYSLCAPHLCLSTKLHLLPFFLFLHLWYSTKLHLLPFLLFLH